LFIYKSYRPCYNYLAFINLLIMAIESNNGSLMISESAVKSVENIRECLVEVLVFNDWDRTLGNEQATMERLYATLELCGYANASDQIEVERRAIEAKGKSFAPYGAVCQIIGRVSISQQDAEERFAVVRDCFRTMPGHHIIYPDVPEYLELLDNAGIPSVVLTYGEEDWQLDKVFAGGWRGCTIITDTPDKGKFISGCQDGSGIANFKIAIRHEDGTVEMIYFNHACLLDDKVGAFASAPRDTGGFVVWREEPSQKQQSNLPPHLETIIPVIGSLIPVGVNQQGMPVWGETTLLRPDLSSLDGLRLHWADLEIFNDPEYLAMLAEEQAIEGRACVKEAEKRG
jgi:hypothetical protein